MKYLITIPILVTTLATNAEVITDGTLGQNINLPGPDFQIEANLGQQHGGNLFHSFQNFNLNSLESATFSGPDSVQNILSRVTGGNPSNIDGLIRSTIPNADMYFLNPYGIMFGPNAQLDVQGSFHVSTADYLRLGENGRFNARYSSDSLLTVAPVEAFGFLTDTQSSITIQDSDLSVSDGKTLSLIGGDLFLQGSSQVTFDEGRYKALTANSKLTAETGRINLASINSGELTFQDFELNGKGGKITLDKTLLDTSGEGSGSIFIRGGQLVMQEAVIQANTQGNQAGQEINIETDESINVSGDLEVILSKTFGKGKGGDVNIATPYLKMVGNACNTNSFADGDSGSFNITTDKFEMLQGALIGGGAHGTAKGSKITIEAKESLSLIGERSFTTISDGDTFINYPSMIATSAHSGVGENLFVKAGHLLIDQAVVATATDGNGNSGNITIQTNTIDIINGGLIVSSNVGGLGMPGNINIVANENVSISGRRATPYTTLTGIQFDDLQSGINSFSLFGTGGNLSISAPNIKIDNEALISASSLGMAGILTGDSGSITIDTENLSITSGGQINNSNGVFIGSAFYTGPEKGGDIQINAKNIVISGSDLSTGIASNTYTGGQGGNIKIQTDNLKINDTGTISASGASTGNAGQIAVQANNIYLTKQGNISTEAENAAGGNILINTPNLLYLHEGKILTSVSAGVEKGGDISIENPTFVVLHKGQIKAQADAGHGGNINIKSKQFITSPDSLISASSNLGLDGEVNIESLDIDMEGFLVVLSDDTVEASSLMKQPCSMRGSSFFVQKIAGSPQTPYDYNPSTYLPEIDNKVKTVFKKTGEKLAFSTCKK
ncbi:filamentous hemagglutinin N-terminal domain-containing protein [Candidatus Halobeggiatoa sp. HSG11]|nr:filamentous hemagglutinin N-terminal domain-containing protein [Candidatus Halobeggiatoa sp. HSG11]